MQLNVTFKHTNQTTVRNIEHLFKPLEDYIRPLKKVKVLRAKKREGLIRARLLGASHAKGMY